MTIPPRRIFYFHAYDGCLFFVLKLSPEIKILRGSRLSHADRFRSSDLGLCDELIMACTFRGQRMMGVSIKVKKIADYRAHLWAELFPCVVP